MSHKTHNSKIVEYPYLTLTSQTLTVHPQFVPSPFLQALTHMLSERPTVHYIPLVVYTHTNIRVYELETSTI